CVVACGTQTGAGGAGAGGGGLVSSTLGSAGGPIPQFDPSLNGTLQLERSKTPLSNTVTTGVPFLQQNQGVANFSYNQGFATGTNLSVGFNNNRSVNNALFSGINPVVN